MPSTVTAGGERHAHLAGKVLTRMRFVLCAEPAVCVKVFKAMRNGVQPVAVKVLNETSPKHLADFQREIGILRGLRDSNVVQFQGISWREGRMMLVTEFMAGKRRCHWLFACAAVLLVQVNNCSEASAEQRTAALGATNRATLDGGQHSISCCFSHLHAPIVQRADLRARAHTPACRQAATCTMPLPQGRQIWGGTSGGAESRWTSPRAWRTCTVATSSTWCASLAVLACCPPAQSLFFAAAQPVPGLLQAAGLESKTCRQACFCSSMR